jgi:hypothetical protein
MAISPKDFWTTSGLAGQKPPIDKCQHSDNFRIARQPGAIGIGPLVMPICRIIGAKALLQ